MSKAKSASVKKQKAAASPKTKSKRVTRRDEPTQTSEPRFSPEMLELAEKIAARLKG
jgi:hypothetical protein